MQEDAYEAYGSDVEMGAGTDAATETNWTSVGCVTRVVPPNETMTNAEVPKCLNAESRAKKFKPGSYDPGDFSYTGNYEEDDLENAPQMGDVGCWRIILGDSGDAVGMNGHISGRQIGELNADNTIDITFTVKVSGELIPLTVASSSGA